MGINGKFLKPWITNKKIIFVNVHNKLIVNIRDTFNKLFINIESVWVEPRLCDYSGLYYCQRCHWNTAMVIPARVIRNWDMEPRLVSRAAAQLLTLLEERSVLLLEELNPKLFTLVPDLSVVKVK